MDLRYYTQFQHTMQILRGKSLNNFRQRNYLWLLSWRWEIRKAEESGGDPWISSFAVWVSGWQCYSLRENIQVGRKLGNKIMGFKVVTWYIWGARKGLEGALEREWGVIALLVQSAEAACLQCYQDSCESWGGGPGQNQHRRRRCRQRRLRTGKNKTSEITALDGRMFILCFP